MLKEYLKRIADSIRSVLGTPTGTSWYIVTVEYDANDEPISFTKTNTVLELTEEEIAWMVENHNLDYTTTTGEPVYVYGDDILCCEAAAKTTINAQDFPDKIAEVYEAGKAAGGSSDSYYDTFWDDYQQNGSRDNYDYAFAGTGWTAENLKPKYDISFISGGRMFANSTIVDLKSHFENLGVTIDFSRTTTAIYLCDWAFIKVFPDIDVSSFSRLSNLLCNAAHLTTVKIKGIKESAIFDNTFMTCNSLANLTLEGTIGQQGFNVQWSKNLSLESLKNIILCLKNYAGTDYEFTYSITLSDESKAILEADGATSPNDTTWLDYAAELGWNIE